MSILLHANFRENQWHGKTIHPGQFVTSLSSLVKFSGLSTQSVRTSLTRLKSTGEITIETTSEFTVVTVANWGRFQSDIEAVTNQTTSDVTNNQQASNKQTTNDQQQLKKVKKDKKENTICAEQNCSPPKGTLPLNDGTEYPIYAEQIEKWQGLYPNVDVKQELRNMLGWLESNPKKRKTKAGVGRFINGWLAREQDKGKR